MFILFAVLFTALKLCGVINWSWVLVLLPLYGPPVFAIVIGLLIAITALIGKLIVSK